MDRLMVALSARMIGWCCGCQLGGRPVSLLVARLSAWSVGWWTSCQLGWLAGGELPALLALTGRWRGRLLGRLADGDAIRNLKAVNFVGWLVVELSVWMIGWCCGLVGWWSSWQRGW